jgi:hypothetical protein
MLEEKAIKVVHDESQAFIEQDMSRYGREVQELFEAVESPRFQDGA